jgi:hypothetical protein
MLAFPRLAAVLIALAAWLGLTLQYVATSSNEGSSLRALWILADYFTIITNLAIATVFTGFVLARRRWSAARLVAALTLAILLVGIIYAILLRPTDHPQGIARIANGLMHVVTPILVPLFWLAFVRKGLLRSSDPFVFAAFPLAYLFYALARGAAEGRYPYPFLNVAKIGLQRALENAGMIGLGFVLAGYVLLLFDGLLSRCARPG